MTGSVERYPLKVATTNTKQSRPYGFQPGVSGNPRGRPKGSRHAVLIALDKVGAENAQAVLDRVIAEALDGDMRAAELLLHRVWPARKGRPIQFNLPQLRSAAEIPGAIASLIEAAADGRVSLEEATSIASLIETQRKVIETADLAVRLEKLEAKT